LLSECGGCSGHVSFPMGVGEERRRRGGGVLISLTGVKKCWNGSGACRGNEVVVWSYSLCQ